MNILWIMPEQESFFFFFLLIVIKSMYIWIYNADFLIYYYSSTAVT